MYVCLLCMCAAYDNAYASTPMQRLDCCAEPAAITVPSTRRLTHGHDSLRVMAHHVRQCLLPNCQMCQSVAYMTTDTIMSALTTKEYSPALHEPASMSSLERVIPNLYCQRVLPSMPRGRPNFDTPSSPLSLEGQCLLNNECRVTLVFRC